MTASKGDSAFCAGDPAVDLDRLAESTAPYVIGVRHHSPAVSTAMPELLEAFTPDVLLVELPAQFQTWLPWLGHVETIAPIALAGAGGPLAFYPFADFSPELVAIRWALVRGIEIVAFDLPLEDPGWQVEPTSGQPRHLSPFAHALRASQSGRDSDDMWDRVVEAPSPGCTPDQVRRAALAVGWALRADAGDGVSSVDLRREAHMRGVLAGFGDRRCVAVVGAFHASALLWGTAERIDSLTEVVTSLVAYADPLLDSRSGYPAGIRDPRWQAEVLAAQGDPAAISYAVVAVVVEVCASVRSGGHPAGPGEAREVVRIAEDLARLRQLPAPGRGELVEALTTVLTRGEPVGLGRVVAKAMERVLVGERRGRLAPGTPRSGLAPSLVGLLRELRLPHPDDPGRVETRLDPLRSQLDRRREVTLQRILTCGIPYGQPIDVEGVDAADALTTRWAAQWTPSSAAMTEVAGLRGVTLEQATEGILRQRRNEELAEGGSTARQVIDGLTRAAHCGLLALVTTRLEDVVSVLPGTGSMIELLEGLDLLARLGHGSVPGLQNPIAVTLLAQELHEAAVRQVDGLSGSTDLSDARALVALVTRRDDHGSSLRLDRALRRLARGGSPLMRGTASAVRVVLGLDEPAALGARAAGWLDLDEPEELKGRLAGLLVVAGPLLEAGGDVLEPVLSRLELLPDALFLRRLAAIRGGFDVLTPAARSRLLEAIEQRLDDRLDLVVDVDPLLLGRWASADAVGLAALAERGLASAITLTATDRWRLVLGQQRDRLSTSARRWATALDELYGEGHGEGCDGGLGHGYGQGEGQGEGHGIGPGAGRGRRFPGAREWADELTELFGPLVCEEVLAAAAAGGRADAVLAMDPASARPSVELLSTVLSIAGGLPEETVRKLRPLVTRVVAELTRALAMTLAPALVGLTSGRPTHRPGGQLDLRRTVAANLRTARYRPDGTVMVVPERPIFTTRNKRTIDWRIILVVDVSGSMESSTVWSALTAAVLAGIPALTTHFLAFSTEVIDLTGFVTDPLSLLLEVSIGGGTSIASGLAAARELVKVPSKTMVVVISDFDEGAPLGDLFAEVRALVNSGVHLLGCASLDQLGAPRYNIGIASQLVTAGMPVAALSPLELARWVAEQVS